MPYITIDVQGTATVHEGTPTDERLRAAVEGGKEHVMGEVSNLAAHVNGDGFVLGLPRNVVGSLTLWCLGMPEQPYAGMVVLTGWDRDGLPTEVCDLAPAWVEGIPRMVLDIRIALGLDAGQPSKYAPQWWLDTVRREAVRVEQAPTPTLQIVTYDATTGTFTPVAEG